MTRPKYVIAQHKTLINVYNCFLTNIPPTDTLNPSLSAVSEYSFCDVTLVTRETKTTAVDR